MGSKKYIVVKNHVREIKEEGCSSENNDNTSSKKFQKKNRKKDTSSSSEDRVSNDEKNSNDLEELKTVDESESSENCDELPTSSKNIRNKKNSKNQTSSSSESSINNHEISASDLEELIAVYKKCKAVMTKIESKYGHLMDKEINENGLDKRSKKNKRKHDNDSDEKSECECTTNKKIYFSEDGQEILEGRHNVQNHICHKILKRYEGEYRENNRHIEIEHENENFDLPEDIQELTEILKNPFISSAHRNSVIEKIKSVKNENFNELRFHKAEIIQSLKTNPDEILCFPGTNISSLPGYPK